MAKARPTLLDFASPSGSSPVFITLPTQCSEAPYCLGWLIAAKPLPPGMDRRCCRYHLYSGSIAAAAAAAAAAADPALR